MAGPSLLEPFDGAGGASEGGKLALILSFELPTSAYATMAVRELTKESSHRADQAARQDRLAGRLP